MAPCHLAMPMFFADVELLLILVLCHTQLLLEVAITFMRTVVKFSATF